MGQEDRRNKFVGKTPCTRNGRRVGVGVRKELCDRGVGTCEEQMINKCTDGLSPT